LFLRTEEEKDQRLLPFEPSWRRDSGESSRTVRRRRFGEGVLCDVVHAGVVQRSGIERERQRRCGGSEEEERGSTAAPG